MIELELTEYIRYVAVIKNKIYLLDKDLDKIDKIGIPIFDGDGCELIFKNIRELDPEAPNQFMRYICVHSFKIYLTEEDAILFRLTLG